MKGSGSPRHDSKDDLKVDLDSNFSHSHGKSFYLYVLIKKVMLNLILVAQIFSFFERTNGFSIDGK